MECCSPGRRLLRCALLALLPGACAAATVAAPATVADCNGPAWATLLQATPAIEARALWRSPGLIHWPGSAAAAAPGAAYALVVGRPGAALRAEIGQPLRGARALIALDPNPAPGGLDLRLPAATLQQVPWLLREQVLLIETEAVGGGGGGSARLRRVTALQTAPLLDALYPAAAALHDLGVTIAAGATAFRLWAPTARRVSLCLHAAGAAKAARVTTLRGMWRDSATGAWSLRVPGDRSGGSYTYLVDVFVRGTGWVRNRVTDPYSISLDADSKHSWIGRLDAAALQPAGWATTPRPERVQAATDLVIYELHLRDFSAGDSSVPAADRGKYLAFTHAASAGMRHLQLLAEAGVTDLHLLPVFDMATVPEQGCSTADAALLARAPPDAAVQQALVMAGAATDCYNWGYDPLHFSAPEGSYASNAGDGAVRIVEFRRMVQALHRAGLRVGMDLVFNHTSAAGQSPLSVLDRVVPGYYQRLDAKGVVETSTCCANTATEHAMMAKLMVDSAVVWTRDHAIDSLRFDLMGHQPRAAMEQLQRAVDRASGRHIHLIGEGWNFGEVANGARFVQASQGSLNGSGIATFSDRARDAVRGGGCCDNTAETVTRQGWLNGQFDAPNGHPQAGAAATRADLLRSADLVRVGLAGTLRGYRMRTHDGSVRALAEVDYAGQGAGYASEPGEVVNYVENHDNATLFDINVLKLPTDTSSADRARIQVLGLATTAFSQGLAYFHAGVELLRSKSLDRNSYDSGDWFNRIDWTLGTNHFGSGLPPQADNGALWRLMRPLLANAAIKPTAADIRYTRDAFLDLLRIRASSALFRLRSAAAVAQRLTLLNTGPDQVPTVVVGHLDGHGLAGAGFSELLYAINVGDRASALALPEMKGRAFTLHPVHLNPQAADRRPAEASSWSAATGVLTVPARTALVYVVH